MYQLRSTVVIDAPRQVVFAASCDVAGYARVLARWGVRLARPGRTAGALGAGDRLCLRMRVLGRDRAMDLQVVRFEPDALVLAQVSGIDLAQVSGIDLAQVSGRGRSLRGRLSRRYTETGAGVLVTDEVEWSTPAGVLGRLLDESVLRSAMIGLLRDGAAELVRASQDNPVPYAVGAAIVRDGLVLAAQRAGPERLAGKWEFPGGKLDRGESEIAALIRECREELGVEVAASRFLGAVALPEGDRSLRVWIAHLVAGEPHPVEHRELRWVGAAEIDALDWLEPDRPLLAALKPLLTAGPIPAVTSTSPRRRR